MEKQTHKVSKRLPWRKVTGLIVAVIATVAIVVGVYSTAMWAGTDYDYQGNEVAQALPVTQGATRGGGSSNSQSKSSTASVIIPQSNTGANSQQAKAPKLDQLNYPQTGGADQNGPVQVVGTPSYPQTGNDVSYGAIALGVGLLFGLGLCYRKQFITFFDNFKRI